MTPAQAIAEAQEGKLRPVYLLYGEERYLAELAATALREATMKGGIDGFNEDKFIASESSAASIVSAARMMPMMAKRRLVVVRGVERWEQKEGATPKANQKGESPLDVLADYAKAPVDSTVMVLDATKLHPQRRLVTHAKKAGFLVDCSPLSDKELPAFVKDLATKRGHTMRGDVATQLSEMIGSQLGSLVDAVERLSLYVGAGQPITHEAVEALITKVRPGTVWKLVDAIGAQRLDLAFATFGQVTDPHDRGVPMLGAISSSIRKLVIFEAARAEGCSPEEAARRSGTPPFKARDSAQLLRNIQRSTLERWLGLLAEADLALKSSRRSADAIIETMLIAMCKK